MPDGPTTDRAGVAPRRSWVIYVAHHTGRNFQGRTVTHQYALTPLGLTRQQRGSATTTVTCRTCGQQLTYRLVDARTTTLWRLGWLALVVLDLAAAAGLLVLTSFDPGIGVWIVGAGLAVAAFLLALFATEYGVRGPGRLLHLPHGIKRLPPSAVGVGERYDVPRLGPPPT